MNRELLDNNAVLNIFREELSNTVEVILTGGAVVDILENRVPKDYDFKYNSFLKLKLDEVATFKYISNTAITYDLKGYTIQLLRRKPEDFAFTIEQGEYEIISKNLKHFDEQSFKTKKLVPTTLSNKFPKGFFERGREVNEKTSATESLMRLPHWKKKGYEIDDLTYYTLIKLVSNYKGDVNS